MKILFTFVSKQAILMRRTIAQILPLQLVFPAQNILGARVKSAPKSLCAKKSDGQSFGLMDQGPLS
jgi:hypothetical protein